LSARSNGLTTESSNREFDIFRDVFKQVSQKERIFVARFQDLRTYQEFNLLTL
jgi:hypothetical protein